MHLRPYQEKALQEIRKAYEAGVHRQLLCMATGTGKTEVFSHLKQNLCEILPGQQLVLLHRDELAKQAYNKLILRNPTYSVHIEAGPLYANPDADVIIGSVQTLGRKNSERAKKLDLSRFQALIVDEAHRGIAESYMRVYESAGVMTDPSKLLLGCTATPTRGDGQGLGSLFQKIVYSYNLRQAIEEGYLVEIKGIRVDTETSLDTVSTKGGDYDQKELADTVDTPARNALVAKAYLTSCEGRKTIGFGVDIKHSQNLAKTFIEYGINAEAVWGTDPDKHKKIKAFRDGEIQVLFNAQLLVEGFDVPDIECVILAAPTKSGVVFSQRVGRGTRLSQGKTDCIVLDVCDSSSRHSLITLPTLLGMPSGMNLRGHGLVQSIKVIEDKLKEYPHLDFTSLKDIDQIEAFIEEVNLFEVKFPPEIEKVSEFTWHPAYTGGYVLMMPDKDEVRITKNLLDRWEIKGCIKNKKYKGERESMEEAFAAADDLIKKEAPDCLKIINREASWHTLPPTASQMKLIKKLFKNKQVPTNLTRGGASKIIGAAFAGKE